LYPNQGSQWKGVHTRRFAQPFRCPQGSSPTRCLR